MHLVSQFRLAVARHRSVVRILQVVGVAGVGLALWNASASVEHERRRWGDTTAVIVARGPLSPGDTITADDVHIVPWPVALAPVGAATSITDTEQVRQRVGAGEVLTDADLAARPGPTGLLPRGTRGVVVPVGDDLRAVLSVGDRVEVVLAGDAVGVGPVVSIGMTSVTVALAAPASAAVADGVLLGTVTVALVGDP